MPWGNCLAGKEHSRVRAHEEPMGLSETTWSAPSRARGTSARGVPKTRVHLRARGRRPPVQLGLEKTDLCQVRRPCCGTTTHSCSHLQCPCLTCRVALSGQVAHSSEQ